MTRSEPTQFLDGALGYFWSQQGPRVDIKDAEARPGYISKSGRTLSIKLLLDDPVGALSAAMGSGGQLPFGFVAMCEGTGAIVLDLVGGAGSSIQIGGARASTNGYTAQTVVTTNEALDADVLQLKEATIRFRSTELFDWASQHAYQLTVRKNKDTNLVESATLDLLPTSPQIASLPGTGEVVIEADWSLGTRTETVVSVELALELTVRATKPHESRALLRHLGALQVLISAVVGGFVTAEGGRALLPGLTSRGGLWNSVLMRDTAGSRVTPFQRNKLPFVEFSALGGVKGLGRWIRLTERHPRVVAPIENRWRVGRATPELQLVECAVAIEYWVAAHRRTAAWARDGSFQPLIIAKQVTREFETFVGDRQTWADRFWRTYNDLKHNPQAVLGDEETFLLAETGYYLLLSLLLDRVAQTKAPSRQLFRHHRLTELGQQTRNRLGTG